MSNTAQVARVFTKPGSYASRAVELLNGKWHVFDSIEEHPGHENIAKDTIFRISMEEALPPQFTRQHLVSVDELYEDLGQRNSDGSLNFDGEFPGAIEISAQSMLDGCSSIDGIILRLQQHVQQYESLKAEGYAMDDPMQEDHGQLSVGIKTESVYAGTPPLTPESPVGAVSQVSLLPEVSQLPPLPPLPPLQPLPATFCVRWTPSGPG
jgi:hypothetical protein